MKKLIQNAMNEMLQRNVKCDYIVINEQEERFLTDTFALDAYLITYNMSLPFKKAKCFMAPMRMRAAMPVFEINEGKLYLEGVEITLLSNNEPFYIFLCTIYKLLASQRKSTMEYSLISNL